MKHAAIIATMLFSILVAFTACSGAKTDAQSGKENSKIAWNNIEDATKYASEQNKKLFVYVYTDWCSWCKRMDKETFADDAVAEYMNKNFVAVSLDAESQKRFSYNGRQMTEQEISRSLGVEGFPTNIFLTSNGETITIAPGYLPPDRFISVLSYIAEDYYQHMNWEDYLSRLES